MATHANSPLSVEAYLESTEDRSSEYVDGRLVERPVPGEIHSDIQWKLCFERPNAQIPSNPPLIAIAIVSPDDRATDVLDKLFDYRNWGVRPIWLIQPVSRRLMAHEGKSLVEVDALEASEIQAQITPERQFEAAQ